MNLSMNELVRTQREGRWFALSAQQVQVAIREETANAKHGLRRNATNGNYPVECCPVVRKLH
jgi:hypothetical protein